MNYDHTEVIRYEDKCIYNEMLKNIYACRKAFNNQPCTICLQIAKIKEIKSDSGKRQQAIRKYETY